MDEKIRKKIEAAAMGFPPPCGEGLRVGGNGDNNNLQTPPTGSVQATPDQSPTSPHRVESAPSTRRGGKKVKKPDELDIFDYIYGVLHCPQYRETYKEFLKIDFPRIPYPASPKAFWDISAKGTKLRQLHLMQDKAIGDTPYLFAGEGDNVVDKPKFIPTKDNVGTVFINKSQYFDNVPQIAWELYIGGYQPAQKWLKDRKTRALSFDDVRHYQKIIKILSETDTIMKTIKMEL